MLNIGRMGRGSSNYYLDAVARTQVDYYHGHGEAPGRWMGSGLDGLELEAGLQVTREALGRVLDGDHPTTGERVAGASGPAGPGVRPDLPRTEVRVAAVGPRVTSTSPGRSRPRTTPP